MISGNSATCSADLRAYLADPQAAEEIDRLLAESSLYEFVQQAWHVIEPATPFVPGWHIAAVCEHLEAVSAGELRDLVITVPPGSTKSITTCVLWPAWDWLRAPHRRWLFASYSLGLVVRDALRCRRLVESPWYRGRWGDRFRLTTDQNLKSRYENDRTGGRISTAVGAATTGEKGDVLVIDDPHNVVEAESETVRQSTITWHDEAFYNRSNDLRRGPHVIIGQRTHHEDLIGHVLEAGGWEHLNIPEEFESAQRRVTSVGWSDPRQEEGELLRPERFGPEQVRDAKARLGSFAYAAQHQQRPVPRSGGLFGREWFTRTVPAVAREGVQFVRYWDKAGTEGAGKYSCGVLMGRDQKGLYYVVDVARGQWSAQGRNEVMLATAADDKARYGPVRIWMEQEPGSGGKESAEWSVRQLAGYNVHAEPSTGSKEVRAQPFAAQAEAGNVRLVAGAWNKAYVDELAMFPRGKFSDQVDASSGAFNKLTPLPGPLKGKIGLPGTPNVAQRGQAAGAFLGGKPGRF